MAIYIDLTLGTDPQVFDDLVQIARCDPGLGAVPPNSSFQGSGGGLPPRELQITYDQKQAGVTSSNVLLSLVRSPRKLLIVGVDSTFIQPDGVPITVNAGVFYYDETIMVQPTIYLDVTDAGGQGYQVFDKNFDEIDDPLPVILYHEL